MSGKVPHAAFVEEYDEDAHITRPETRQVANGAAKHSRTDLNLKSAFEPLVDGASDSGYSSRTAATVNSTQSGPSGRKSPPHKVESTLKRADLERVRSTRKDRTKDRSGRPARDDKMQVGAYPSSSHHPHLQRSPSRRRREAAHVRHYPGTCWECDQGLYHPPAPVEPSPMDYPYYVSQPAHVHDYRPPPPSPQTPRYPPSVIEDVHVSSRRPRARSNRSISYHSNNRPVSMHDMVPNMGGVMYNPSPLNPYEHGPPLSSSAYKNQHPYHPSQYPQPPGYFPVGDFMPPPEPHQDRSMSRPRDAGRARRSSVYSSSVADYDPSLAYEDGEPMERRPSREQRPRMAPHYSYDRDEDYYRMPPPPMKPKPAPQIIQKRPDPPRKSATTTAIHSERRPSRAFDMSELEAALPGPRYRHSSRETIIPERSLSTRDGRRSNTLYYASSRRPRDDEGRRRHRASVYNYPGGDIEEKQREAEEYQAATASKSVAVPLTADALSKAKAQRAGSESGSQKSGSNSSRGSENRSKAEDDKNIVMTMNGVTMSFTQESVGGKRISVRTGDTGAVELNIAGKRPKKYLTEGSRSNHTSSSGRREVEDPRRARDERRSDRASRRSSRSTYSGRIME